MRSGTKSQLEAFRVSLLSGGTPVKDCNRVAVSYR